VLPEFEFRPDFIVRDLDSKALVDKISREQPDLVMVSGLPYTNAEIFELPKLGTLEYQACSPEFYYGSNSEYWILKKGKPSWLKPTVFIRKNSEKKVAILSSEPWRAPSTSFTYALLKAHLDFQLINLVYQSIQQLPAQNIAALSEVVLGKNCPVITLWDEYMMTHKTWSDLALQIPKSKQGE
jgi:hypothetical protein